MGRKLDEQGLLRLVENIKGDIRENIESVKTDVIDIQSGLEENKSSILELQTELNGTRLDLINSQNSIINKLV